MNNNNLNASKFARMIKSKGFVTAVCAVIAVAVLLVGYNIRINNATKPVRVPVAIRRLSTRHLITEDDVKYVEIPRGALGSNYYSKAESVIGKYVNVDTTIPEGSLFYSGAVISREELPDEALLNVKDGETLYYLTVNMLTSYTNSILPNRYIDLYVSTKENGKALVGKLLTNVKVLQVKTADGLNVFDDSEQSRTPYVILFALPEEQHLLLRKINAINNYSIAQEGGSGFARIEIIPVPTTAYYKNEDEDTPAVVSSTYLKDFILDLAATIPEDVVDINFVDGNKQEE